MFQATLNDDWAFVQQQIERTKIRRYPYKVLLGMSLTKYVLSCREEGLDSTQTLFKILRENSIKTFLLIHEEEKENILKNIEISVRARFSEEKQRGR